MGHIEPVFAQLRNLSALVVIKPCLRMPSIAIVVCDSVQESLGSFPIQRALFPFVDEADRQNRQKDHHSPETDETNRAMSDRPREQKGDFEIEQNEEDGYQVVAHIELHTSVFEGLKTALIGRKLFSVGAARPQERTRRQQRKPDQG